MYLYTRYFTFKIILISIEAVLNEIGQYNILKYTLLRLIQSQTNKLQWLISNNNLKNSVNKDKEFKEIPPFNSILYCNIKAISK